jgi:Transposase DDE domain group 1
VDEKESEPFQFTFNGFLKVAFQGSRVTSDAGLVLIRELDERLGLEAIIAEHLSDSRCSCSASTATAWPRSCDRGTSRARTTGKNCSCRRSTVSRPRAGVSRSGPTPPSHGQRSTRRWRQDHALDESWPKFEHHVGELFPRVGFIVTNLQLPNRAVVRFYNKRGTAEQWIKEGKQAAHWTRLSCHRFRANEVRLQLSVLAYNLGNLWRRLVLPTRIDTWSLTSLQQRLVKTGGRLVKHTRYYWLLLAESHLTRRLFGSMLQRIWALPVPTG